MTTEERIAQIANNFGQGFQNFQAGQEKQRAVALQDEARRRQEALQALEASAALSKQSGRIIDPAAIQPFLKTGDVAGIGSMLSSAEYTPETRLAQEKALREQQMQDVDMLYKQAQTAQLGKVDPSKALDMQYKQAKINELLGKGKGGGSTKGQEALDKEMAKRYADYTLGGSIPQAQNVENLDLAISGLQNNMLSTGPTIGSLPDSFKKYVMPQTLEIEGQARSAVQGSLKEILGASYTEKEGERVFRNSFDPNASPQENARKLNLLKTGIQAANQAKEAQFAYFNENGTMRGYKGPTPSEIFNRSMSAIKTDGKGEKTTNVPGVPTATANIIDQINSTTDKNALIDFLGADQ